MPEPPKDLVMPAGANTALTIIAGAVLAAAVVYGIRRFISHHDPVLLYLLLGGALMSLIEPIIDILGLIYIPEKGTDIVFRFFGRGMPLFNVISYAATVGVLAYIAYRYLQRGITFVRLLQFWIVVVVFNFAFETSAVLFHLYRFYGTQPLNPWGFPLWFSFVNTLTSIVAGALLVRLYQPLKDHSALPAAALLVPMGWGLGSGATAWPMWLALNSDLPRVVLWIAAALTLGLVLFVLWIISNVLADPVPVSAAGDSAAMRS